MSMSISELEQILSEASPLLKGRHALAFRDAGPNTFMLILEDRGEGHPKLLRLLISLRPHMDRAHLTPQRSPKKNKVAQTAFSARIHDLLEGMCLDFIEMVGRDRVLRLRFSDSVNSRKLDMVLELIGRHANLLILNPQGMIDDLFKEFHGKSRSLIRGVEYTPPPLLDLKGKKKTLPRFAKEADPPWPEAPLNGVADRFFQAEELEWEKTRLKDKLLDRITQAIRRKEGMLHRLAQERDSADDADRFKATGDLLQAHFHLLKRGMSSVDVPDLFEGTGKTVAIDLDASKDPSANVAAYYKRFKKLKNSMEHVRRRIRETEEAVTKLRGLQDTIPAMESLEELQSMAMKQGLLPADKAASRLNAVLKKGIETGVRRFLSSDRLTILVGKDGKANDRLTFQTARGNDMWLHCQNAAGSHVVVKKERDKSVPLDSLIDAGLLAKHFSKRRNADRAEVIYAQRKHIRKIKGAPPGRVRVERHKSLLITRDPDRLKQILDSGENSRGLPL